MDGTAEYVIAYSQVTIGQNCRVHDILQVPNGQNCRVHDNLLTGS